MEIFTCVLHVTLRYVNLLRYCGACNCGVYGGGRKSVLFATPAWGKFRSSPGLRKD